MLSLRSSAWIRKLRSLASFNAANKAAEHFAHVIQLAKRTAPPIDASLLEDGPFISFVVILHNPPKTHLDDLLESFRLQPARSAELILYDNGSTESQTLSWLAKHEHVQDVRIVRSRESQHSALATNLALALARGAWVGFADPNDALTPYVVQLVAQTVREHPLCQLIYTDEAVCDEELRVTSYALKPAYDEVMLSSGNYVNQLSCYRRDRLLEQGGMRAEYEGAQDFDLLLRYVRNLRSDEIKHLPYPGYRRRVGRTPSAEAMKESAAGASKALAERYRRGEAQAVVQEAMTKGLHRVRLDKQTTRWPRVSVIIPNRNSFPLISRVLADLKTRTDYPDLEVIVIDNGTTDPQVLDLYEKSREGAYLFKYEIEKEAFNFSRQINRGIAAASGELILLLNNDIEVIEGEWLREMVSCFEYPDTGVVGARLLYPSRRLQHAGAIIGLRRGLAAHWFVGRHESFPGPMARLHIRQSLTAVTAACMLISRACLDKVGHFDEFEFPVAYNDMDFCLRAVAKGFRVVWTPFATLIHHETASRGRDNRMPTKLARLLRERRNLRRRHNTGKFEDPAFSPWYSRNQSEPSVLRLDQLPKAR